MSSSSADVLSRLDFDVVTPGDDGWDEARQAWNLSVDQRPVAVAFPRSVQDVATVVQTAVEQDLRVAAQGTGHGATAMGSLQDTVLLKTSRMAGVEIDPQARRARVQAGAEWKDLTPAAAQHGLASLSGSAGDVGVVGYSVGGGLGWLSRRYGLACNAITSAEAVTADGSIVRADRDSEPDLFWALRGGGGSFAIVTELEFELVELSELYAGVLFWPQERAVEVLAAWRDWVADVPEDVTSLGRLLNVPPFPEVPEALRGRSFVVVEAACLGDPDAASELLAPLRALDPEIDTFATIPPPGLAAVHMDPPQPVPGRGDGVLLASLPDRAIEDLIAQTGPGTDSPLVSLELRHLGGALGRPHPDGGALDMIDAQFAQYAVGIAATPEMAANVNDRLDRVQEALGQCATGTRYLNFSDRASDAAAMFSQESFQRLCEVKRAYDPDDRFQANQPIAPAAA